MKKSHLNALLLIIILILPSVVYANIEQHVTEWTEKTLMTTLSADPLNDNSEIANVRKHYMHAAWESIEVFFNEKRNFNHDENFILHPEPITTATIVATEDCDGASCWRIHQSFIVPEMRKQLEFLLLVVTTDPGYHSPFVIQSLSLIYHDY